MAPGPLPLLQSWIDEARAAGLPHPASTAFVTAGAGGQPSARTVTLKRIDPGRLIVTSALWTRKVDDIRANPQVALLFHWPSLGRQVLVTARAQIASRELAEELFAERDVLHRWQTVVSRQGDTIDDLQPLRDRLDDLTATTRTPPPCPPDWGALSLTPLTLEFWTEAADRLHERRLFTRDGDGWAATLLAP